MKLVELFAGIGGFGLGFERAGTAGFSDSVRYRMLGNAVTPPMVGWIANRLKSANA